MLDNIFILENKGDFIFAEWKDEDLIRLEEKEKELKSEGYIMTDRDYDYLNRYDTYQKGKHRIVLTLLCT